MLAPLATAVQDDVVVWRLPDPDGWLDGVRLWVDFDLGDTRFHRAGDGWELALPVRRLPPVDRLEYLFEVSRDGGTQSVLDPGNACRVGGAFGDHSWLSLGYRPPAWLDVEPAAGQREPLVVSRTPVGEVDVQVWSPAGTSADEPLPLLLSHDGPEMDVLGELTRYVGAMIATSRLPPVRVGLVAPGARNERYAANPAYAEALCEQVVPAIRGVVNTPDRPVLMGQSLGALAALHAEWTHPGTFAGLLLQSGSFFTAELDAHESRFAHWEPVTAFVAEVHRARRAPGVLPVAVGWGSAEENAGNNRHLVQTLTALGLPVSTAQVRDGHTFTCWRDLLDPLLTDLLDNV